MRIAHISDVHIGPYPGPFPLARYQDIEKILNWTADRLITEKVDLVLLCGDCFKDAKVMLDRASQEIASIVRFLRRLSDAGIETIVISGTPSHDAVAAYELMNEMGIFDVSIFTQPSIYSYMNFKEAAYIACLPGLNRSALLTQDEHKGLPPERVHRIMTDKITQLCIGMAAQMPDDKPKILMAHMTYQGADTGFTDLLMQHEPILTREAVEGFDLVCLGHIHRPQCIDNKIFYSGPIERLSFNDEDVDPGFIIYDLKNDGSFTYDFISTPARRYMSMEWKEGDVTDFVDNGKLFLNYLTVKDSIVRLHYSCPEETAQQLNRKQLEKSLYDAGAFFITEIKADIERSDRARDNTVNESLSVPQALEKWAVNQGIEAQEVEALKAMAVGLMEVEQS